MRGVTLAVALAVLLSISIVSASSVTIGINETYTVASKSFLIEPINAEGLRYIDLSDNRTKLWKADDCMTIDYMRTCLSSSSTTSGTFTETFLGAIVQASHSVASSSIALGEELAGTITLTNKQPFEAENVRIRLTVQGPGTFRGGETTKTFEGTVATSWTTNYELVGNAPGAMNVTGTVTYFDRNTTQTLTLPERRSTVTIPFTLAVTYDNATAVDPTELFVLLTRKNSNLSVTIEAAFPPETEFIEVPRFVREEGQTLTRRTTLINDTKVNLSAWYSFTSAPSEPLTLTLTYRDDDAAEQTYTITYPFAAFTEGMPSLGVRVDPTPEGEAAFVRVLVTGNTTGALDLRGEYIDDARIVGAGTHEFYAKNAPQGNHSFNITYTWSDAYGTQYNISGKAVLPIIAPLPEYTEEADEEEQSAPAVVLVTDPRETGVDAFVWVIGGLAAACLGGLAYILLSLRKPVRRVEELLRKAASIRRAHGEQHGTWSEEERARLAELEAELAALQKKL
jgi:hypothetical protein